MNISDEEIRRVVPNYRNYQWGQKHFREYENYNSFDVHYYGTYYVIDTDMTHSGYYYSVQIKLDKGFHVLEHTCDCYFHNNQSGCGHVAAALLLFQEIEIKGYPYSFKDKEELPKELKEYLDNFRLQQQRQEEEEERRRIERMIYSQREAGNELLRTLKQSSLEEVHRLVQSETNYHLQVHFEARVRGYYDATLVFQIDMRIGDESLYVVKNIPTLLDMIEEEEYHEYGKKLAFLHHENAFDEFTKTFLSFLKLLLRSQPNHYYYDYRHLVIPSEYLDDFYDLFVDAPRGYIDIKFEENALYLPLYVHEEYEGYIFDLGVEDNALIQGKKYLYGYSGSILHRIHVNNYKQFIAFYDMLVQTPIYVEKDKLSEFSMYTLQAFKENLDIQGTLPSIEECESNLMVYFDIEDGFLTAKVNAVWEDGRTHSVFEVDKDHPLSLDAKKLIAVLQEYGALSEAEKRVEMPLEEDKTITFYEEVLPALNEYAEVFINDTLRRFDPSRSLSLSVGVKVKNDLLSLDISSLDCTIEEIKEVMGSYRRKKHYHRLRSGDVISLQSKDIEELDELLQDMQVNPNDLHKGGTTLPLYYAFELNHKLDTLDSVTHTEGMTFQHFLDNFTEVKIDQLKVKGKYKDILKPYQLYGVKWLMMLHEYRFGGILADDMGLGKTLQAIALMESCHRNKSLDIVICPASLMLNWQDEFEKFSSDLKVCCVYGSVEDRDNLIANLDAYDVVITTYDYIRRDYEKYENMVFQHIFLDEAQYIKNHLTKAAKAVKCLHGKVRFALTGTPIENSLAELWSIFDFLMPGYLFNYHQFKKRYETPIVKHQNEAKQEELKQLVEPFLLRRRKQDVLKDLPDKLEKTLSFHFNAEEEKLYAAKCIEANKELRELIKSGDHNKIQILKMLSELRQICCEPRVLYDDFEIASSKMNGCMEVIESLKESGKPLLLFSSFTRILDLIAHELKQRDISYLMLTGETSKPKRKELVTTFQAGGVDVFLISLKAGGVGLNLTRAEAVIHYDPWWNLSAQNQATDRAHRIGQKNTVQVINLIMKNSIEENILKMQQRKKELADVFIENSEGSLAAMSTSDIVELIKR